MNESDSDTRPTNSAPLLRVLNLSKSFPGVQALNAINLSIHQGQVHAVVGENGAGKSTLMRILAGLDRPDQGQVFLKGTRIEMHHPHQALQAGISMIHQELLPFPELTVAENIFMGHEPTLRWLGWIDTRQMASRTRALLNRLGAPLRPARRMKTLSTAEMQTVEIAKALAHNSQIIIMDEPTSSLSDREVEALFEIIRELKQQGVAVVYISHKLEEIFRIADVVTVLRDGCRITTCKLSQVDERKLINLMVGREFSSLFPKSTRVHGEEALTLRGLSKAGKFSDIEFTLHGGEVLGLAGLMGSGRTEVASAVYGLAPADAGEIRVHGQTVRMVNPKVALKHGIAMVSEDRKTYGLVLPMTVNQNITLASLSQSCRGGFISGRREKDRAEHCIQTLSIKTRGGNEKVGVLSGGNQQKVVLAKALLTNPSILILDEPTRGIDLCAKAEIYSWIGRLAQEGKAILLVSSELPEILSLSDRILVLREGRISAELDPHLTNQEEIMQHAMPH